MKYVFSASLDEINGIFIPKILISSIYYADKRWYNDTDNFIVLKHNYVASNIRTSMSKAGSTMSKWSKIIL